MTDATESDERLMSLFGQLADEFTDRLNRGEQPDLEDYARRHPEIADALRTGLAALLAMRQKPTVAADVPEKLGDFRMVREAGPACANFRPILHVIVFQSP